MTKDQIELLRPGFEAAIIDRFKESGFLEVEIRVECLSRCGESYNDPQVAIAWWAWTQSRESLVVELPSPMKGPDIDDEDDDYEQFEMHEAVMMEVNGMRSKCKQAIMNGGGGIREAFVVEIPMALESDRGWVIDRDETVENIIAAGGTVKS